MEYPSFRKPFGEDIKGVFDSLDDVLKYVDGKRCFCGYKFNLTIGIELGMYKHPGGWLVKSLNEVLWLYVNCPNCGSQVALWKLRKGD